MKKRLALILVLLMTAVLVPFTVRAAVADETSGQCGDDLYWSFDQSANTLTITGSGAMYDYTQMSGGRAPWYSYYGDIRSAELPSGLTRIGDNAFYNCVMLRTVTVPEGVTAIGASAFQFCPLKENLVLPESLTFIGEHAFEAADIWYVTIPAAVAFIGDGAFSSIINLREIRTDADNAYYTAVSGVLFNKDKTELITYPAGRQQSSYSVPGGVRTIRPYACSCAPFTTFTFADSVSEIGAWAFFNCSNLKNVTFGNGVTTIGINAFRSCTSLETVFISRSVASIHTGAFPACDKLTAFTVDAENPDFASADGVILSKDRTRIVLFPTGKDGHYEVPDGISCIGERAFYWNCTMSKLTSIYLPLSVTRVEYEAFGMGTPLSDVYYEGSQTDRQTLLTIGDHNTRLLNAAWHYDSAGSNPVFSGQCGDDLYWSFDEETGTLTITGSGAMYSWSSPYDVPWGTYRGSIAELALPEGLSSVGGDAFFGCTKLKSVTIPSSVTGIGNSAFANCAGLQSAAIGDGVKTIGELAFCCTGLTSVTIPESVTNVGSSAFMDCSRLQSVVIPDSAASLGGFAFSGCAQLSSVSLGSRVTGIGRCAFQSCGKLTEITIPDSVTSIGDSAFSGCRGMSSITLGNGLTKIGAYAFRYCEALQAIAIPDSVTGIGAGAFIDCRSLTPESFQVGAGNTAYKTVDGVLFTKDGTVLHTCLCGLQAEQYIVPEDVTSIGDSAFYSCADLTSVILPDGVTGIGKQAFYFCTGLEAVTIPESVTAIGDAAFQECSGLTAVAIPSGVTAIGVGEFSFCSKLTSVVFGTGVTSIGKQAFYSCPALTDVYYLGTEAERYQILDDRNAIADDNEQLLDAEWHYMTGFPAYSTVTFRANGGEGAMEPQAVRTVFPEKLEKNRFVKEGYTFAGWNTDADGSGTAYTDEEIVVLTGSAELYAQWEKDPVTVIDGIVVFDPDDVSFRGTTPYVICNGSAQTPRFTVKDADGNVIDPAYYDYEYLENTNGGTAYVNVTFKNDYTGTVQGWFKIYLPATEHTYVENVSNGIKVSWDPVEGAAGYVIYRRAWSSTTNGWTTFARWNNTTDTTYIDGADANHKVYAGTRYQYGIKAYFSRRLDPVTNTYIGGNVGDNFNLGEGGPLKTTVRITTRTLNSVTAGTKQMTVKWGASSVFTGYQIKYATDANFTKNVKAIKISDPKTAQTVISGLTSGTTYYVTVRSYHEFNGMTYFGEWSNAKSCKVK